MLASVTTIRLPQSTISVVNVDWSTIFTTYSVVDHGALALTYYCNFDMRDNFETRKCIWLSLFILQRTKRRTFQDETHYDTVTLTVGCRFTNIQQLKVKSCWSNSNAVA